MDGERSGEPVMADPTSPPRRKKRLGLWVVLAVVIVSGAAVGVYLLVGGGKVATVMKYAPPDTFAVVHVDVAVLVDPIFEEVEKHKHKLPGPDIDLGKIRDFCAKLESIDLFAAGTGREMSMLIVIRGSLQINDFKEIAKLIWGAKELPLKGAGNGRYGPDPGRDVLVPLLVILGSEADDLPKGVVLVERGGTLIASGIEKLGSGDNKAIRKLLDKVDTSAPIWAAGELPEEIYLEVPRSIAASVDPLPKGESRIVFAFRNADSAEEFEKDFREMQKTVLGDDFQCRRDGLGVILTAKTEKGLIAEAPAIWARAQKQSRRVISGANLSSIGSACFIYADDHDGRLPDDLGALCGEGGYRYLPASALFSPSTGRPARLDESGKPVPPFDYICFPIKDFKSLPEPSRTMIAYERPENYKDEGTWVLMADCHVAWVSMEEFARRLARSEQLLKEQEAP